MDYGFKHMICYEYNMSSHAMLLYELISKSAWWRIWDFVSWYLCFNQASKTAGVWNLQ